MKIENCPMFAIEKGTNKLFGNDCILIQITSPSIPHPNPKTQFKEIYQFEFDDAEFHLDGYELKLFDDNDAEQIINILLSAYSNSLNVCVNCHAGVSRSGTIALIGEIIGFELTNKNQIPNLLIKRKLLQCLNEKYVYLSY
jgi:predicted protein tyrosine phosphatase